MSGISDHYDVLANIQGIINGLSLTGISSVVIQEVAEYQDNQQTLPFVSISPYGPEQVADELNDRDGVYYGTLVAIIGKKDVTSLEQRLGWRQTIRRNLNNRTSGLTNSYQYNYKVEPGNVVEVKAYFDRKLFISGMVVRSYFQEPRS